MTYAQFMANSVKLRRVVKTFLFDGRNTLVLLNSAQETPEIFIPANLEPEESLKAGD